MDDSKLGNKRVHSCLRFLVVYTTSRRFNKSRAKCRRMLLAPHRTTPRQIELFRHVSPLWRITLPNREGTCETIEHLVRLCPCTIVKPHRCVRYRLLNETLIIEHLGGKISIVANVSERKPHILGGSSTNLCGVEFRAQPCLYPCQSEVSVNPRPPK